MNNKGFITVGLILYLPMFFTLLFSFYWIVWFLNQKHLVQNICYQYILSAQGQLIVGNNKVLKLNAKARKLIAEKKFWNKVLKTAPPKAKAVAFLRKKQIVAQQLILKATQKTILTTHEFRSRQEMSLLQLNIKKQFRQIESFWRAQSDHLPIVSPMWRKSQLQIEQKDIAPTYKRANNHSDLQTLKTTWSFPLQQIMPSWLVRLASIQPTWQGHCESHPNKKGGTWHSSIGAGKASLKQLF